MKIIFGRLSGKAHTRLQHQLQGGHILLAGRSGSGVSATIDALYPVLAAEKKRRGVKFLPAQVLRKLGIHIGKL